MFERVFKLSAHKTSVKTEVMAGITTFMTMAYILAVNPSVLGSTGMDTTAILLATALASFVGTACMGPDGQPAVCLVRRYGPERFYGLYGRGRLWIQLAGCAARGIHRGHHLYHPVADQRARGDLQRHPADAQKGRFRSASRCLSPSSACRTRACPWTPPRLSPSPVSPRTFTPPASVHCSRW